MGGTREPIGVVLAGGAGRRIGGGKAAVALCGEPLVHYPLRALQATLADVVVVAKAQTALPPLPGVAVWREPDEPRHPLAGLVHALARAAPRAILACAGDLPLVGPELVGRIAHANADGAPAVVPCAGGRLQPLLARYEPAALGPLAAALADSPVPSLTAAVQALAPRLVELEDELPFFNVNRPEDLPAAASLLGRRGGVG